MWRFAVLISVSVLVGTPVLAAEYRIETTLSWLSVQEQRPEQPSTQHSVLINFATSSGWVLHSGSGGAVCGDGAAVLPAENGMLKAVALSAISSGAIVQVIVDSTLPRVHGYCQISVLSIKGV